MSTLLGPDGRFTFANVPAGAQLRFTRDDGIDARVAAPSGGSFTVEINGNTAAPGRRRVAAPSNELQFEGTVVTAAADSLVVHDSHNADVTVKLTDTTVIRHGQTPINATDLKAGDRVHVKATVVGDVKTATEVIVQDTGTGDDSGGDNGATTMTANGTVNSVGTDSLVVSTVPKGDVTVQVDASTVIRKQGSLIKLSDIHAGDGVNTLGTKVDDHTLKARQIEVRGSGKHS